MRRDRARVGIVPRLTLDITWRDLFSAFGLDPGGRENAGDLEAAIGAVWPGARIPVPALSVRTALDAFLKTRRWSAGDAVLMSAVNIGNMAAIVEAHGLTVVPVDLDLTTLSPPLDAVAGAITSRTRAYVHAHLYGTSQDLAPYAEVCHRRGVTVIEDCAQACGGDGFAGSAAADLSLFSFGPIKTATSLGGAVALIRDPSTAERVRAQLAGYARLSEAWFRKRIVKHATLKVLSTPLLYRVLLSSLEVLGGTDADAWIGSATRGFKHGDLLGQLRHAMPRRMAALLARRLRRGVDVAWRVAAARHLISYLSPKVEIPGRQAERNVYWLLPVLAANPAALIRALARVGFDATQGTTSMRALGSGSLVPNARHLMRCVVYLPLSPLLRPRDLRCIAEVVNLDRQQ